MKAIRLLFSPVRRPIRLPDMEAFMEMVQAFKAMVQEVLEGSSTTATAIPFLAVLGFSLRLTLIRAMVVVVAIPFLGSTDGDVTEADRSWVGNTYTVVEVEPVSSKPAIPADDTKNS